MSYIHINMVYVSITAESDGINNYQCYAVLAEIKWINVHRNTTVFSICWRKQLHVSALFWVGHHQVETRTSGKTHILQCGHQAWGMRSHFTMFGEECSYIYVRCGLCDVYDFICRVLCKFIDTWAGVVFWTLFWKALVGPAHVSMNLEKTKQKKS
jgi:hypothetical protein